MDDINFTNANSKDALDMVMILSTQKKLELEILIHKLEIKLIEIRLEKFLQSEEYYRAEAVDDVAHIILNRSQEILEASENEITVFKGKISRLLEQCRVWED